MHKSSAINPSLFFLLLHVLLFSWDAIIPSTTTTTTTSHPSVAVAALAFVSSRNNNNYYSCRSLQVNVVASCNAYTRRRGQHLPTYAYVATASASVALSLSSIDNCNDNGVTRIITPAATDASILGLGLASSAETEEQIETQASVLLPHQDVEQQHCVEVVYEDADYFFVMKPPGMVCTGGDESGGGAGGVSFHDLVKSYGRKAYQYQPGLLHRLDKGTSGLMIYAKSTEAAKHYLRLQEHRGSITKQYLAIVHGAPPKLAGRVEGVIGRSKDFRTYVVRPGRKSGGKRVLTTYKVLSSQSSSSSQQQQEEAAHSHQSRQFFGATTCLSLRLFTGRKHQIRASCRKLECPIVGDVMYGGPRHPVMLLHAQRLAFTGANGTEYNVTAATPPSWNEFGVPVEQ